MPELIRPYQLKNLEQSVRKLKDITKKLKFPNAAFDEEETELIYRVFYSLVSNPDKIKSERDKQLAKQIVEKTKWTADGEF